MLLHGIFPPITTPFYPDGNLYFKKLEHNVERYSKTPVAGIVALGSTGEAILLSDQERRDVLKSTREAAAPNKVLIAGTGSESAIETLRLTEYAAELGYDVAMVRTPHYYKKQMQPANILAFYRTVTDRSPLPVIIYNLPQATGYDIPAEIVIELAEHPNLIGIKESSGDVKKVSRMVEGTRHVSRSATVTETFDAVTPRMLKAASQGSEQGGELVPVGALAASSKETKEGRASREPALHGVEGSSRAGTPGLHQTNPSSTAVTVIAGLKTRQKEIGFQVLVGAAQTLEPSLQAGAVGAILAFADAAPTVCYEIYAAWKEGDIELARLKQERIAKAAQRVAGEMGIPGIKYAMDFNGYFGGPVRLPLLPLTVDLKTEVEQLMADIRN
ncbi:MAG TPA: dihydrodipicolinate synthase family protein [Terriglobales bacterium]|nr:dihydrodipicolinate synthase family protein [Terriglobales bacterium]